MNLQEHLHKRMMHARQQQFETMVARQRQAKRYAEAQQSGDGNHIPLPVEMALTSGYVHSSYDGLPITHPTDLGFMGGTPDHVISFETACKQNCLSTVQSIVSQENYSPALLHHGLTIALRAGSTEISRYLLSTGAPIVGRTAKQVLTAPSDAQIPLFELLSQHGWSPNNPDEQGAVLLPTIVTNHSLLRWFLEHGADPNIGRSRLKQDVLGELSGKSCAALEAAAARGDVEAVRLLLDAGASIQNGNPLHYAAGACQPGIEPHHFQMDSMQLEANVLPPNMLRVASKEFDISRIPVMALLVQHGADVNQRGESRLVAHHAIMYAVMAGAVERVRWLLAHGADPEARGAWGSAIEYVAMVGSDEMKSVVTEGMQARQQSLEFGHDTLVVRTKPGPGLES